VIKSRIVLLLFLVACSTNRKNDDLSKRLNSNESVKHEIDVTKYEDLPAPPPHKLDRTQKTDSSVIEIKYFEDLNSIREFNRLGFVKFNGLDSITRTYYKDYYYDTRKIKEQGVIEGEDAVGLWKYYDANGFLKKTIDYKTGEKKFYGIKSDPYDDILLEMKEKADSTLIKHFGYDFFKDHLQWNPGTSYYYTRHEDSGNWFDIPEYEPEQFQLTYSVSLDKQYQYSLIRLKLDRGGRLIHSIDSYDNYGLKKCVSHCNFRIDYPKAVEIAKQNGLKWNSNDCRFYLSWIRSLIMEGDFLGEYEMVMVELSYAEKFSEIITIDHYKAVIIDPWTGNLKRKCKFQNVKRDFGKCRTESGFVDLERTDNIFVNGSWPRYLTVW
jgi:hypothetical protein